MIYFGHNTIKKQVYRLPWLILWLLVGHLWLWAVPSVASGPWMHAYLGIQWLTHHHPEWHEDQKNDFLKGTLFPDIRYLTNIERAKTHLKPAINDKMSPFEQGMRFHNWVDQQRNHYVRKHLSAIRQQAPKPQRDSFMKLMEDQFVFDAFAEAHINQIKQSLGQAINEQFDFISQGDAIKWYLLLQIYFSMSPKTFLDQVAFVSNVYQLSDKFDTTLITKWQDAYPKWLDNNTYRQAIIEFVKQFPYQLPD